MNSKFKLTFNKPTVTQFLGEEFTGLKVRIEGGEVELLPVANSTDDDVIPIQVRGDGSRGGAEMIVEGAESSALLELFTRMNPEGRFFTLERKSKSGGWISLIPYTKPTAPPKFTPHMRVWSNPGEITHVITAEDCEAFEKPVEEMTIRDLRDLNERISAYEAARRPGRPPREILAIKAKIDEFRSTVTSLLPVVNPDMVLLDSVYSMLGKVLHKEMTKVAEPMKTVVSVPEAATALAKPAQIKAAATQEEPRSFRAREDGAISEASISRMAQSLGIGRSSDPASEEPPTQGRQRNRGTTAVTQRLAHGRHRAVAVEHRQGRRVRVHAPA